MQAHALKHLQKQRRSTRIRSKLHGTAARPRLSVHRSNKHIFVQAINDDSGVTVVANSDLKVKNGTKTERAQAAAKSVASALKKAGITKVVFDRGSFRYHGRVQAVADALRTEGIEL